jgi:hypothetical protein
MEDAMTAHGATPHDTPLGTIESRAPSAALLAPVQMRVEIQRDDSTQNTHLDTSLHIKRVLMAISPADNPNAVTAIDP